MKTHLTAKMIFNAIKQADMDGRLYIYMEDITAYNSKYEKDSQAGEVCLSIAKFLNKGMINRSHGRPSNYYKEK